jgi:membrane dipeptidase
MPVGGVAPVNTSPAGAVVFDATCPTEYWVEHQHEWSAGGFTGCALSVGGTADARETLFDLGRFLRLIRETDRLILATSVSGLRDAASGGDFGIVFHFQGAEPLAYEVDLVEVYWRLGVRVIQLAYNRRNPICDGCEEPRDAGLSLLGRRIVRELNEFGVVVDVSHTGERSALEAVECSSSPCIASHSNAYAVHPNRRNLSDDLIRAIAASGGVIGMNGFPSFVSESARPNLDAFIDHMIYIDELVGSGHVGLGIDYYDGTQSDYEALLAAGIWSAENYGPPPYVYPAGIERPSGLRSLTKRLLERGYDESGVRGILGENWLRVYDQVWL